MYQHTQTLGIRTDGRITTLTGRSRSTAPTPLAAKALKESLSNFLRGNQGIREQYIVSLVVLIPKKDIDEDVVYIPYKESLTWNRINRADEAYYCLNTILLPEDYAHLAGYLPPERAHRKIMDETLKVIPFPAMYANLGIQLPDFEETFAEDCTGVSRIAVPYKNILQIDATTTGKINGIPNYAGTYIYEKYKSMAEILQELADSEGLVETRAKFTPVDNEGFLKGFF